MKLIVATLTAATFLASAASAMTPNFPVDPRDAALSETAQITTGTKNTVTAKQIGAEGRWSATLTDGQVNIYTFESSEPSVVPSDIR